MSRDVSSLLKTKKPLLVQSKVSKPLTRTPVVSQKFLLNWKTSGTYLISNVPKQVMIPATKVKIAAFDLDGTLIDTKSGQKFARGADDWKLWKSSDQKESLVVDKLRQLIKQDYKIVIFTNQGAVSLSQPNSKSYVNFTNRVGQFVKHVANEINDFEPIVYASTKKPPASSKLPTKDHEAMRKPQIGMWNQLLNSFGAQDVEIDMDQSFYVGDAAGRPNDFLDSDKVFADNIKLEFKVPEQVFI